MKKDHQPTPVELQIDYLENRIRQLEKDVIALLIRVKKLEDNQPRFKQI